MKRNILTLGAVMVAFGAFADSTWYTSDKNATYSDNYVIRKEYWKDGAEAPDAPWPVATRDYVLGGPREYTIANGKQSAEGLPVSRCKSAAQASSSKCISTSTGSFPVRELAVSFSNTAFLRIGKTTAG